jgi:hypothetical protein
MMRQRQSVCFPPAFGTLSPFEEERGPPGISTRALLAKGPEPLCDDTVLELAFEDTKAVKTVAARIDGRPAKVRMYSYSRGSARGSHYPDRIGNVDPGAVEPVLDIE